jgi:hypothetical protein
MHNYQYLYCASCATRRAGHGYQCSVCGSLLRRPDARPHRTAAAMPTTTVLWQAPVERAQRTEERQPVAA